MRSMSCYHGRRERMSESRRNPRAAQYAGELPDAAIGAACRATVQPSEAWQKEAEESIKQGEEDGTKPLLHLDDKDREVVIEVSAIYAVPMRTVAQAEWPKAVIPASVIRIPMLTLKQIARDAMMKDNPAIAELIKMPGEEPKKLIV